MPPARRPLLALVALLVLAPSSAAAERRATPLADVPPAPGAEVRDLVVRDGPAGVRARAAQSRAYATADGQSVRVSLSPSYAADDTVARSYVDFVSSLPHGEELGRLVMRIVPPQEVGPDCGAEPRDDVLACYLPARNLMVVPGEDRPDSGATPSFVVAHEYGHHVANHRNNAPFPALDFGPKRWASEADVCSETLDGRLAPGNEETGYLANPGEAWAETYALLRYPEARWSFTELLRPTTASLAAARLDVAAPWTRPRAQTFRGRLGRRDASDAFTFRLALDGALRVELRGPRGSQFDLDLRSRGRSRGRTSTPGSRDLLAFSAACVREPETVTATVRRRSGAGPYTVRVVFAG